MTRTGDGVDEASLHETILSQTDQEACIPVLLLTDALLEPEEHPATVLRHLVGLDPAPEPEGPVFGAELYALQSLLGTAVLEGTLAPPPGGVLALNFHHIAERSRPVVRDQLARAATLAPSLVAEGATDGLRVLVAFYDGFRDTALFGAEECDRLGLRAVFFPIFASGDPERAQLSDADLAELADRHELGVHTSSHRTAPAVTEELVEQEVVAPVRRVGAAAGRTPRLAAWCGGSRYDAALPGNRALRELGVQQLVSNWSVERIS
ncbi:polysaccharide deacetylase family protein [Desertihabitans aurantiacus]|uniref:polysaccharide deacetylase family protein n=1 Tax=Desertihabitans aurantiacus TaxID=2282477 RepID=UPI001300A6F7|nr:polysaccharide deacetylase family protein [Desertihabitans aurantiacus]